MLLLYAHAPCCFFIHMHHAASLCTCTMLLHYAHVPCCFITHIHHAASLRTCTMLLHYAHAPCCFITHIHHAASLCTCTKKINPVISVTQQVYKNTLHMTQRATECKQHPAYELHKCNSNHANRFNQHCSLFSSYFTFFKYLIFDHRAVK